MTLDLGALALCAACAGFAPRTYARQASGEAVALEVGKPVERELKGGEAQSYGLKLDAGQFARLVVQQKGIDVVVRVLAPGGAMLALVDSPNGVNGPEPAVWATEASGVYRVEIEALEDGASGRYEIRVLEVRPATETERKLVEAPSLNAKYSELWNARKYGEAFPFAERALALYERVLGPDDLVYTLAADGTVRWADLGEAGPIEAGVSALREVLRSGDVGKLANVEKAVKPRARALDALVFAPVRKLVGASTRLLIAPDEACGAVCVRHGGRRGSQRRGRVWAQTRAGAGGKRDAGDVAVAGVGPGHARPDDRLLPTAGGGGGARRRDACRAARDAEGPEAAPPLLLGELHRLWRVVAARRRPGR